MMGVNSLSAERGHMRIEENRTPGGSDLFGDLASNLMRDLREVADWKKAHGKGGQGPFLALYDSSMPMGVRQAVNRLNAFTYDDLPLDEIGLSAEMFESLDDIDDRISDDGDIPGEGEATPRANDFPSALSDLICGFDEREFAIFNGRFLMEKPRSLDDIGEELGLTRERIRQIEKGLRERVRPVFDEFSIDGKLAVLFNEGGGFIRSSRAGTLFPEFEEYIPNLMTPVKWMLRNYCRLAYEEKDGWLASPSILEAKRLFKDRLGRLASRHGVLDEDALLSLGAHDGNRDDIIDWAKYCGVLFYRDHPILCGNIGEYAEAVLEIEGRPMSTEELQAIVDPGTAASSFRQKLYKSRSIIRTDVRMWGLRDWKIAEYNGIEQAIIDMLNAHHGMMRYDSLVNGLLDRYSVSKSSIWAKISNGPFTAQKGVVTLNDSQAGTASAAEPYSTARLFRLEGGWAFRFTVARRLENGSGLYTANAVAGILHMRSGEVRYLPSPIDFQRVAWTDRYVTIGTIRRFIVNGTVNVGREAFCLFKDDGSFAVVPMRAMDGNGMHDALALACLPETDDGDMARRHLAVAIGLPPAATFSELIRSYDERGDSDIARRMAEYAESD